MIGLCREGTVTPSSKNTFLLLINLFVSSEDRALFHHVVQVSCCSLFTGTLLFVQCRLAPSQALNRVRRLPVCLWD